MRLYGESHSWVKMDGKTAVIGISKYYAGMMGKIRYVEYPDVGGKAECGAKLCTIIAQIVPQAKILAPVSGKIVEVNRRLVTFPEILNEDPLGEGWLVKVVPPDYLPHRLRDELAVLMDENAYFAWLAHRDKPSAKGD
ncbi:MAG: hypothetical protein A2Y33_09750 [Spirochaetes bacterium GWF1_51_8]|nr:MAG: hypothetical protein A2Y33_09750 [Spirochaetes bacterium GWF1_51_8]